VPHTKVLNGMGKGLIFLTSEHVKLEYLLYIDYKNTRINNTQCVWLLEYGQLNLKNRINS
jgi:hypothetical protein